MTPDTLQGERIALPSISLYSAARRLSHVVAVCAAWLRPRRTLSMLNDHALRDIGMTRAAVDREIHKALWYL